MKSFHIDLYSSSKLQVSGLLQTISKDYLIVVIWEKNDQTNKTIAVKHFLLVKI